MLSQSSQQKTQLVAVGGFGQGLFIVVIMPYLSNKCNMCVPL